MSARILVVDDEANIRALIEEILSEEGYDVTTAADAKEARSARKRQEFDLILLDIWMPDTDGISLLREWSEDASAGTVVMMSSRMRSNSCRLRAPRASLASAAVVTS